MSFAPDSILVLLDTTPSGELAKSSAALLGAAAEVGTPVALVVGDESLAAAAGELGAAAVLVASGDRTDALAAAADLVKPDAVLVSHSIEGRETAGRFAVRSRSALAVDAVGIARDDEGVVAQHSVYGGSYNVQSAATFGAPVITVRQGAVDARAEAVASPQVETLTAPASGRKVANFGALEEAVAALKMTF